MGMLGAVAVLGAAAACALFLVTTTQIPAVFSGEQAEALMRANRSNFGWEKAALVAGAAVAAAVPAALVARRRATRGTRR